MHRKTLVGATVAAVVLSAGGIAIAAQVSDDGTVPAKITNFDPPRGKDKAYDEAVDTGYMPVIGRDGVRAGVIKLDRAGGFLKRYLICGAKRGTALSRKRRPRRADDWDLLGLARAHVTGMSLEAHRSTPLAGRLD